MLLGADIYIEGKLLVELKSDYDDYLKGFYQALHYAKLGLTFSAICVVAKRFVRSMEGKQNPRSRKATVPQKLMRTMAPSAIGVLNAKHTTKAQASEILKAAVFRLLPVRS